MNYPIKTCVICEEEFELKPDKPGFANRCPECSVPDASDSAASSIGTIGGAGNAEMNEARRSAIRDLLYRKDS